jgi:superoxide dismutase, Cu-Zn family
MRIRGAARALVIAALAGLAGGCDTMKDSRTVLFGTGSGLSARLVPLGGSAATGAVGFVQFRDNVGMTVSVSGLRVGWYRVVIHANGNCSSPNGFSAGPPWAPPGVEPPLDTQVRRFAMNNDVSTQVSVRLTGVTLDGANSLIGRSVVIHEGGEGSLEAVPDVRNGRAACGVIGPVEALF